MAFYKMETYKKHVRLLTRALFDKKAIIDKNNKLKIKFHINTYKKEKPNGALDMQ